MADELTAALLERGGHIIDLREVLCASVVLLHISVLLQPLIFAHLNGFTALGMALPEDKPKSLAAQCG